MDNTINFGIDLGTTNSAIAKYSEGEIEVFKNPLNLKQTLPSVVAFRKKRVIVGDKAREVLQKDPQNVIGSFKRKMGTSDKYFIESLEEFVSAEDLSAYVLKELKNFIHTGEQLDAAVITIPASFDTMQSNATKKAGYQAGFQQVVLLQEPIAASLAYANKGKNDLSDKKWMVYDLGGGTFDVALVAIDDEEMKVMDHEGNNYLGGTDFDKAIVEKLIVPHLESEGQFENLEKEMKSASGKYNRLYNVLLYKAEEAKIALTNSDTAEIEFEVEDDTGEELDIYFTISKSQFNEIIQPFIDQTIQMMESVLNNNDVEKSEIEFILMIGGSTYIPAVREQLAAYFNIEVNCNIDPTTAVGIGAAYFAGMKMKNLPKEEANVPAKKGKSSANALEINVAFSKVAQDEETAFIASVNGIFNKRFYRISRADGGYDSGLKPLERSITEYLPLVENVYNQFTFKVFDEFNNVVETTVPSIGITHGKFSIDGQPLPNDICLEVDSMEDQTTFLEPIFKKNSILPAKKTIVKEMSRHIIKGSDESLIINILEGSVDSLPAANKTIGYIHISGKDLTRDLVKGSDVELTFEVSESRDLTVQVYLSLSDQEFENKFSPSETHISLDQMQRELREMRTNLIKRRTQQEQSEKYELAASLSKLIKKIEHLETRISNLDEDDVTDEKYQIDEAKRAVAREIHVHFNSSLLKRTIEEYYKMRSSAKMTLVFGQTNPEDQKELDRIMEGEKAAIKSDNVQVIKMKINQLKGLMSKINSRQTLTNADIVSYFGHIRGHKFNDQRRANELVKKGETAMQSDNYATLLDVVNQLYALKRQEEQENQGGGFKSSGTGLQ